MLIVANSRRSPAWHSRMRCPACRDRPVAASIRDSHDVLYGSAARSVPIDFGPGLWRSTSARAMPRAMVTVVLVTERALKWVRFKGDCHCGAFPTICLSHVVGSQWTSRRYPPSERRHFHPASEASSDGAMSHHSCRCSCNFGEERRCRAWGRVPGSREWVGRSGDWLGRC